MNDWLSKINGALATEDAPPTAQDNSKTALTYDRLTEHVAQALLAAYIKSDVSLGIDGQAIIAGLVLALLEQTVGTGKLTLPELHAQFDAADTYYHTSGRYDLIAKRWQEQQRAQDTLAAFRGAF